MTDQKNQIKLSADFIKANSPFKGKVSFAVVTCSKTLIFERLQNCKKIKVL